MSSMSSRKLGQTHGPSYSPRMLLFWANRLAPKPRLDIQCMEVGRHSWIGQNTRQLVFRDHAVRSVINGFEYVLQFAHIRRLLLQPVKNQIFRVVVSSIEGVFQKNCRNYTYHCEDNDCHVHEVKQPRSPTNVAQACLDSTPKIVLEPK